jgi:predicted enzyme related to lactoylglutathione lyase
MRASEAYAVPRAGTGLAIAPLGISPELVAARPTTAGWPHQTTSSGYRPQMHKSRVGALFIDHPSASFEASLRFWEAATGRTAERDVPPDYPYRSLGVFSGELLVELQQVGDGTQPRIHLDIDTDDVEAEVQRLEKLGATRLRSLEGGRFWQMVDPGGLVFCVIPPHTSDFEEQATTWS